MQEFDSPECARFWVWEMLNGGAVYTRVWLQTVLCSIEGTTAKETGRGGADCRGHGLFHGSMEKLLLLWSPGQSGVELCDTLAKRFLLKLSLCALSLLPTNPNLPQSLKRKLSEFKKPHFMSTAIQGGSFSWGFLRRAEKCFFIGHPSYMFLLSIMLDSICFTLI